MDYATPRLAATIKLLRHHETDARLPKRRSVLQTLVQRLLTALISRGRRTPTPSSHHVTLSQSVITRPTTQLTTFPGLSQVHTERNCFRSLIPYLGVIYLPTTELSTCAEFILEELKSVMTKLAFHLRDDYGVDQVDVKLSVSAR